MKEKHPNFDIFIDDNYSVLTKTRDFFGCATGAKSYVLPAYKTNKKIQGSDIYHVKNTISGITNRDFALGALEYRTNKLEQGIKELNKQAATSSKSPTPLWLIILPIFSIVLALLVWMLVWKRKQSSN